MAQPDQDSGSTGNNKADDGRTGIAGTFRPLVKELVKVGLVAYETVSEKATGLGKQFNELLEEARSEAPKPPSTDVSQEEPVKRGKGSGTGKVKDSTGKTGKG